MKAVRKQALVTGGAKRIGAAIVRELAAQDYDIVLHFNRSRREAVALAKEVASSGARVRLLQADFSTEKGVLKACRDAGDFGPIDVLVNSASLYESTPLETVSSRDWDRFFQVNLKAIFTLSRHFGMEMRKNGHGGVIINLADMAGARPYRNHLPYCVSKGALLSLTRALAVELAPEVRVNSICPGPIVPSPRQSKKVIEKIRKRTPLRRWGGDKEIAEAVNFLCRSTFTTGANVVIDGGFQLV